MPAASAITPAAVATDPIARVPSAGLTPVAPSPIPASASALMVMNGSTVGSKPAIGAKLKMLPMSPIRSVKPRSALGSASALPSSASAAVLVEAVSATAT